MSVLATDNFNRADSTPLSGNWANSGYSTGQFFKLESNTVKPSPDTADDIWSYYNAATWPSDQYSAAKLTTTSSMTNGSGPGVCVRQNGTVATWTQYRVACTTARFELQKIVAGTFNLIWNRAVTFVSGDRVLLSVFGTTLRVYNNGSQVGADATDSTISSGNAGIIYSSVDNSASIDDWEGGDMYLGPKSTVITRQANVTASFI